MVLLLLTVFILGALTVVAVEAAGIWVLIRRLNRKAVREETKETDVPSVASSSVDVNPSLYRKQGNIWVLEPERIPEIGMEDKVSADQRRRKEITEVTPLRKFANIKDQYLIVTESDGSTVEIFLRGCTIFAVSATSLSTQKWAKKYPIKVESKGSAIYKGQKTIYLYLETSWEKESWCKALRLASYNDEEKKLWFSKLNLEFQSYLALLTAVYPSFVKPFGGLDAESMDNSVKFDNSSSKVRQFLKKLGKKGPKGGHDSKGSGSLVSGYEDMKLNEKSLSFQDSILGNRLGKMAGAGRPSLSSFDNTSTASSNSSSAERDSRYLSSGTSNVDSDHMRFDEGSLCLNLLISRLFFDVKNNLQSMSSLQNRIQRALSNIRMPSYIGEVTCTAVDPGTLPPHILAMRALPSDMNEVWALEIDIEYVGGTLLEIETRVAIQELEAEGEGRRLDTPGVGEVTSDLLEDFEYFEKQLKLSDETIDDMKQKRERDHGTEETENAKSSATISSQVPKWKSVLRSFSKHVSQVPISLGIRISSIRGTIRLCLKSPPSDQLWFGFTSMPDIEFNLESFVGDHKITNGHLAIFLINRFKMGIRDTLVLPNRESLSIPWMLGEKDDWVPRKAAPFMWYKSNNQDNNNTKCMSQTVEASKGTSEPNLEKSASTCPIPYESLNPHASSLSCIGELSSPLLEKDRLQEFGSTNKEDNIPVVHARSLALIEGNIQSNAEEEDESRFKRLGTRERMRGLGKKMGEKLEVKRRHIEEKGRNLVERMKGPP